MRGIHRRLLFVCMVFCAPCAEAAAPASTSTIAEIRNLAADLVQGRACSWLIPFDEVALNGKIADDAARVRLNFPARDASAADAAAKAKPKAEPCGGPADQQMQAHTMLLRLEWLARADALYRVSEATAFGKDMTLLGASQPLRQREYDRLREALVKNAGAGAWEPIYAGIVDDARRSIDLACADRVRIRSKTPRKCPTIANAEKKFIPVAVAQLKSAEAFAAAYTNAAKAVAATSVADASDRSKLWKAVRGGPGSLFGGVPCEDGDKVAAFNGPRSERGRDRAGKIVVMAPVIALGNPLELGTVTVAPDGPDYVLLNADSKAIAAGVGGSMVFKRCAAG